MVMSSNITINAINPDLEILGAYQRIIFSDLDTAVKFQAYSLFEPTALVDSVINIECRNEALSGFRLKHITAFTDTNDFGSFRFQSFVADDAGTDIWGYEGINFRFYKNVYFPSSTDSRRIVLWDIGDGTTDYQFAGIGTSPTTDLDYQVPQNKSHQFYEGTGMASASKSIIAKFSASYSQIESTTYAKMTYGYLSWVSNSTSTPSTANVPAKALGTTTLSSVSRGVTMPADNRLTFTPVDGVTRTIPVIAEACVTLTWPAAGTPLMNIAIYKNGVQLTPVSATLGIAAANFYNLTARVPTTLTNGDYLELWVNSDTSNAFGIKVVQGSLSVKAV